MILGFFARGHIKSLERELAFWKTMWRVERQRANLAVDRLLAEKSIAPITAPVMPDTAEPSEADKLLADALANEDLLTAGHG